LGNQHSSYITRSIQLSLDEKNKHDESHLTAELASLVAPFSCCYYREAEVGHEGGEEEEDHIRAA
jgi:hypothetical protein